MALIVSIVYSAASSKMHKAEAIHDNSKKKKKDAFAAHTAIPMEMYWFLDAFGTQLLLLELSSYVAHGF